MEKWEAATIQETSDVHRRFGTHKCVPYAHAGKRPIHLPVRFQFAEQSACTVYEKRFYNKCWGQAVSLAPKQYL